MELILEGGFSVSTDFETIILSICLVLLVENIEILVTFLLLLFLLAIGIWDSFLSTFTIATSNFHEAVV